MSGNIPHRVFIISVKSKLASVISAKTNFAMGKDLKSGEVLVREYGKGIPGILHILNNPRKLPVKLFLQCAAGQFS